LDVTGFSVNNLTRTSRPVNSSSMTSSMV